MEQNNKIKSTKSKNNKLKILKRCLLIIGIIITLLIVLFFFYLCIGQNKAYVSDIEYMEANAVYDNGYYEIDKNADNGFIFYPGAKVSPEAYAYLGGIDNANVYIPKFPFNFAFFKPNIAGTIIENESEIENWYIGGHSLGGVFADIYAQNNTDIIKGEVFLGSYPAEKMPEDTSLNALTIYGTNDGVVGDYSEKIELFNKNTQSVAIEGGNHTQFGNYELQKGDNESKISAQEQHEIIVSSIEEFIAQ